MMDDRRDPVADRVEELVRAEHARACARLAEVQADREQVEAELERLVDREGKLAAEVDGWASRMEPS